MHTDLQNRISQPERIGRSSSSLTSPGGLSSITSPGGLLSFVSPGGLL